jgi:hypothetical protein
VLLLENRVLNCFAKADISFLLLLLYQSLVELSYFDIPHMLLFAVVILFLVDAIHFEELVVQ